MCPQRDTGKGKKYFQIITAMNGQTFLIRISLAQTNYSYFLQRGKNSELIIKRFRRTDLGESCSFSSFSEKKKKMGRRKWSFRWQEKYGRKRLKWEETGKEKKKKLLRESDA